MWMVSFFIRMGCFRCDDWSGAYNLERIVLLVPHCIKKDVLH